MSTMTEPRVDSDEQRVVDLVDELLRTHPPATTPEAEFLGAQYDLGLAWVHFPEGSGGLGLSPKLQKTINEAIFAAGGPNPYYRNPIGYGMCGPTVVEWGTEAQKQRYLRPLFTGEEIWCQLFSEPGSGSDFAGLSSRGVRDGDEWIVNGQKVWTTLAHVAALGPARRAHRPRRAQARRASRPSSSTCTAPGVETRPLRQMTGEAEFNEVYFTDARIPDAERLGEPGDGWRVSLTTLMNERVSIGGAIVPRGLGPDRARRCGSGRTCPAERKDAATKDELMKLWIEAEVNRLTNLRASQNRKVGHAGAGGLDRQARLRRVEQARSTSSAVDLLGADGMLYGTYEMERPETAMDSDTVQKAFLRSRANSIEGGTSEVMRNILGERVLGLPGDVRVDREVAWKEVPRN